MANIIAKLFDGERIENLDAWMPKNPRERTFYSYTQTDGTELVSRSKAFHTYPRKMKNGKSSLLLSIQNLYSL